MKIGIDVQTQIETVTSLTLTLRWSPSLRSLSARLWSKV